MEIKPSISLGLRPALIMTPRLQQALKLLQVPTLELQQILKMEIMQNPLHEEVDEVTDSEDLAKEDSPEEKANEEADEPFVGIDPIAVTEIQDIVGRLRDRGLGVLITDHNVRETLRITDRAYIMYEGRILLQGTAQELAGDARAREIYLGERFSL